VWKLQSVLHCQVQGWLFREKEQEKTDADGGRSTVNTGVRQSPMISTPVPRSARMKREGGAATAVAAEEPRKDFERDAVPKTRVFIAAENRLLQEALARMLAKRGDIDVIGAHGTGPFQAEELTPTKAKILLLASRGRLAEVLMLIRKVRTTTPEARILLLGMTRDETDFLQSVRAGSATICCATPRRRKC
jgi:hypothetical protein